MNKNKPDKTIPDHAASDDTVPAVGTISDEQFLKIADEFIDAANRQNQTVGATDLHMAFLYAAARYNAHVAKNVVRIEKHESFVKDMLKTYQEMLRNHLADPNV